MCVCVCVVFEKTSNDGAKQTIIHPILIILEFIIMFVHVCKIVPTKIGFYNTENPNTILAQELDPSKE